MIYREITFEALDDYSSQKEKDLGPSGLGLVAEKTMEWNLQKPEKMSVYIWNIEADSILMCCLSDYKEKADSIAYAKGLLEALSFKVGKAVAEEITVKDFSFKIVKGSKAGLVPNGKAVIDLGSFSDPESFSSGFIVENLIEDEDDRGASDEYQCSALRDEVSRIQDPDAPKSFFGHPVHYLISADNEEVRASIRSRLLSCLYGAGRLVSRRVAYLEVPEEKPEGVKQTKARKAMEYAERAYEIYGGGVIDLEISSPSDNMPMMGSSPFLAQLSESITSTRMDVLTVLECSAENEEYAEGYAASLGKMRFVKIKEDFLQGEESMAFLKKLAEQDGVKDEASLEDFRLAEGKGYTPSALKDVFLEWKEARLCREVYKAYGSIYCKEKPVRAKSKDGKAFSELDALVGLDAVKEVVRDTVSFNKVQKVMDERGLAKVMPSRHMVFAGAPGTAKTTVARLYARILKEEGVLEIGDLVEVGRKDLVGKYLGWTAKLVEEAFQRAKGSVLFIDEAYALSDEKEGSYGDEAINSIVQLMENHREDTVVIFAGYKDRMEDFLDKNPGLRSRISLYVNFDDYSVEELQQILSRMVEEKGMSISQEALDKASEIMDRARGKKDFGNGRFVRNLFEKACIHQARRLCEKNLDEIPDEELLSLAVDDFQLPQELLDDERQKPIGFFA